MTVIADHAVLRRRDDLLANDLSESETVMLDISEGTYFGVRDVGRTIWDRLASPTTFDALCRDLVESFEVDDDTCRRETRAFLGQLADRGLIEVSPASSGS